MENTNYDKKFFEREKEARLQIISQKFCVTVQMWYLDQPSKVFQLSTNHPIS